MPEWQAPDREAVRWRETPCSAASVCGYDLMDRREKLQLALLLTFFAFATVPSIPSVFFRRRMWW